MPERARPARFYRTSKFESYYKDLDKPIRETVDQILKALEVNYASDWLDPKSHHVDRKSAPS
jgi:hypothetical protein